MAQTIEEFARDYETHLNQLFQSREPEFLDAGNHGKVVLLDDKTYQEMMDRLDLLESAAIVREHGRRKRVEPDE